MNSIMLRDQHEPVQTWRENLVVNYLLPAKQGGPNLRSKTNYSNESYRDIPCRSACATHALQIEVHVLWIVSILCNLKQVGFLIIIFKLRRVG